jgi:hypothetical protein
MDLNLSKQQAKDIGEVQEVDQNYILIQKGTPYNNERFYIPMYLVEKNNGNTLWFRIDQVRINSQPPSNLAKVS